MKNEKSLSVSLKDINFMVGRYLNFEASIKKSINGNLKLFEDNEVRSFIESKEKNVFIFDKDSILKLLENSQSEYLVVALGAHEKGMESQQIEDNSFTVMTVSCYEKDGNYYPIDTPAPGEEWPHGIILAKFEQGADRLNGESSFFFSII